MNWKTLKTAKDYDRAVKRTLAIFHADEGSPEADELALLLLLVKEYEEKQIHIPTSTP